MSTRSNVIYRRGLLHCRRLGSTPHASRRWHYNVVAVRALIRDPQAPEQHVARAGRAMRGGDDDRVKTRTGPTPRRRRQPERRIPGHEVRKELVRCRRPAVPGSPRRRHPAGRRTSPRCAAATTTTVLMMRTGPTSRRRGTCSRATASPRRQRGARSASARTASGRTTPCKRRAPAPEFTPRAKEGREFTSATPPVRAAARCSP